MEITHVDSVGVLHEKRHVEAARSEHHVQHGRASPLQYFPGNNMRNMTVCEFVNKPEARVE